MPSLMTGAVSDAPGQPRSGYDYDTLADDLADVLETTGAQEAAIIGFSMGGGEVARYMSRHDGKGVIAAGLIASVVPYMAKTPDNPDGTEQSVFDQITQGLKDDRAHFLRHTFFKQFFGVGYISSPVSDEVLDWATNVAMQAGPADPRLCGVLQPDRLPSRPARIPRADAGHPWHRRPDRADRRRGPGGGGRHRSVAVGRI